MRERLLHKSRRQAPGRRKGRFARRRLGRKIGRPRRAGQFQRAAEQPFERAGAQQDAAVRRLREERRAAPLGSRLARLLARPGLRLAGRRAGAVRLERAGPTVRAARRADRRADIHQRLREIARPVGGGQRRSGGGDGCSRFGDRRIDRVQARHDARDVAVDRRGVPIERDGGDRRRRIGADAGQRAQHGLVLRKGAAALGDLTRAGVQVAGARIIAEPGEGPHHLFERRGGEVFDARPQRDEALEIGDRRPRHGLLQQNFGQPDAIGVGALAGRRPPGKTPPVAIPPGEDAARRLDGLRIGPAKV